MKIVALHGWRQNKQVWNNLLGKLDIDSISLDLPGFGKEKIVNKNWGVPEYAKWVENKIGKYKDVVLIGHSFGGRIAVEIASKNPKWLKAVVLSGSPNIYNPRLITRFKIFLSKLLKPFIPIRIRNMFLSNELKNSIGIGLEDTFRKSVVYDQTDKLKKIYVPTLLIWGSHDAAAPLHIAKKINNLIKQSELKIIENVGHNSFIENPNLFYSYVKKFIENIK